MTFPILRDGRELKPLLADRPEIRFAEQESGTTVVCYMMSRDTTFDLDVAREARGLVYDTFTGDILSRPLHKFHNVYEKPHTQPDKIDWSKATRAMVKRDGSMIHTVVKGNPHMRGSANLMSFHNKANFAFKSKKSFTSDVVREVHHWLMEDYAEVGGWRGKPVPRARKYVELCNLLVNLGQTAIFEWTAPQSRIVLGYTEPDLQLLHVRHNVSGQYMGQESLEALSRQFNVPLVESVELNLEMMLASMVNDEIAPGTEGWVIQFADGDMVKIKTKWYMDRHHAMTFLRVRDIARMVLDESLDDLKSKLAADGIRTDQLLLIESQVGLTISGIMIAVERLWLDSHHLDRKTVALTYRDHPLFGLLMQLYSDKEPDYRGYFEKHHLKQDFGLEQINLVNSTAERDDLPETEDT
jgi:RNA ligase